MSSASLPVPQYPFELFLNPISVAAGAICTSLSAFGIGLAMVGEFPWTSLFTAIGTGLTAYYGYKMAINSSNEKLRQENFDLKVRIAHLEALSASSHGISGHVGNVTRPDAPL
jgi:hypothetical protein